MHTHCVVREGMAEFSGNYDECWMFLVDNQPHDVQRVLDDPSSDWDIVRIRA